MHRVLGSAYVKGFVGAIIGGLLLFVALHLYLDHKALHDLVTYTNQTAPKINKLP